ncbi:hypothetical protein MAM1_0003c00302 [Mucor ambiguus]|uniref:Uncharacterized protein n=1 Tax=Mucor ambiguus TaxID=91626 RepID=A0A0C9MD67_9FUNG|nr:hypothetical protein MAM1_0003c00302 [Mucor ambiguus]
MSALTEMEANSKKKQADNDKCRKRAAKKRKSEDNLTVQLSHMDHAFKDSITSTEPNQKSAVHNCNLLEDMLQPSSDSEDDYLDGTEDTGSGIIISVNEQKDLAVTHNEAIVHQKRRLSIIQRSNSVSTSKPVEQSNSTANIFTHLSVASRPLVVYFIL